MSSRNPAHFPINNDTFMNELTYETALAELESIVETLEKGDLEISQLTPQLRRAQQLLAFCNTSLGQVEKDVNSILSDNRNEQE